MGDNCDILCKSYPFALVLEYFKLDICALFIFVDS